LKKLGAVLVCVVFCLRLPAAQLPVVLGSTSTFAVLASSTVTNTGPTVLTGNLGLSPGSSVTGFPPGSVALPYGMHVDDGIAVTAQNDLTTAYNDAATSNRDGGPVTALPGDIGGLTLTPGLYNTGSTLGITGVVTLNGQGNANSVFVFQIGSALTTAVGSQVALINGANAANIFWQVGSSATLGVGSIFNGTILAEASITVNSGATLNGRALALTGAVTLSSNGVVQPGPAVTGGVPPTLTVFCPVSTATANTPYNSSILATGGTTPYTFSTIGALPAGLTLNPATGAITGTPSTAIVDPLVAHAVDSALGVANASCSITVVAAVILTCPSSAATVGTPYNSSLVATGGTVPYTYSLTSGTLPAGLALRASSGAITGTPTTAGPDVFTAHATDLEAGMASQSCSITTAALPPPTVPAPTSLSLVLIGLACAVLYRSRERIMRLIGRS
jgi:hypothetical protein